jgi:hypothetical protein
MPGPVGADPEPALEAYEADCVIADVTPSFFRPDMNAPFGPTLGAKRRVQIVARVPHTLWVAGRGTDERLFFFPGSACIKQLE